MAGTAQKFDAIIVGAGQAGPPLAGRLTAAGQTVAVIERKLVGGTCVNSGCIPTKTLVASAHAAQIARRGAEYGVGSGEVTVDMAESQGAQGQSHVRRPAWGRVMARGHGQLHADPRACAFRGSAHHPGRRPGSASRQDLPERRRSGSGAGYAGAVRHRLHDQCRNPRSGHAARASRHHRWQLYRAGVRSDVPALRCPCHGHREGPAADLP